jgi:phosphatidylinositol alpha-mannosyltransferase
MRVGLVCPYSLTVPGGVQVQVLGLARSLRALGHEARVLAPCDGPPPDAGVTPLGASVPTAANGSVAPLAPDPACQLRTIRALRDEAFDVVHLHEPLCPGPTQTALLFHNTAMIGTFHAAGDSASYKYLRGPLRWLAGRLDHRCAVSAAAAELAGRYLGGEYTPLFNGIEVDLWAKAEPWPSDGPTVLFVGRHEPRKGLEVLLAAVDRLPAGTRVWVAGDGPDTADLRHRHTDPRIEWLGRIGDEEKRRRMAAADVFCAPALRGESFGIVLLEAMAAGTPVVASDIDGYRNVATDGVDARLVEPGDPAALGAALVEVLDDHSLAASLVSGGQSRAEQFSMHHLAERYLDLYRQIA